MTRQRHGWIGRGRVRVARLDERYCFEFDGVATRAGPLRKHMTDLCRKEYRTLAPGFSSYSVSIWIEAPWDAPSRSRRVDVYNVAKAYLDTLSGFVWRDDSQVVRLSVEKVPAERERVTMHVEPHDGSTIAKLVDLRFEIAALNGSAPTAH